MTNLNLQIWLVSTMRYLILIFLSSLFWVAHVSSEPANNFLTENQDEENIYESYPQPLPKFVYPEPINAEGLSDPTIAYGLSAISDWHPGLPFLNIMKMSRQWIGHLPGRWGGMTEGELYSGGFLDQNGWVKKLPESLDSIGTAFAWGSDEYSEKNDRVGEYQLTYEGVGELKLFGVKNIRKINDSIIHFTIDKTVRNWWFKILSTNENNYIRNISIIKSDNVALHRAGAIFNPKWLSLIKDARQLRFMDMMDTNNSSISSWNQVATANSYTYFKNMPIELMVRLANEVGSDPWFTMPFHADDTYIRNFANYVHENLNPELIAHIEYSNEVWNFAFKQSRDARYLAMKHWRVKQNTPGGGINYYSKRAVEVMRIWTDVFSKGSMHRLKRVAGVQSVNTWLTDKILTAPIWKQNEPESYVPPSTYFDAIAVTTYFGSDSITNTNKRNALIAALENTEIDNNRFHYEMILGEISGLSSSLQTSIQNLLDHKELADSYELELIAYEGGQHVHHSFAVKVSSQIVAKLQAHMIEFVRSEYMAKLYSELWRSWKKIGQGPFMHFTEIGTPSKSGSWGIRASLGDNTPRSVLLDRLNETSKSWWESRAGIHFQQGLIQFGTSSRNVMPGTERVDYFIGSDGDDLFFPHLGNDGVNGGLGKDTVLFNGNRDEYTILRDGPGIIVDGPDGNDYLYDIEIIRFNDLTISTSLL